MLTAPGTRHAIPMTTEGSAAAIPAFGPLLVVSSEESVDSTILGVEDLAVSMLVEEDGPVAISGSTIKSLFMLDEMFCVRRKGFVSAPSMLGGYGRYRKVLVKKSSRDCSYLLGSLHQRIQEERTTSDHLDVSVAFVISVCHLPCYLAIVKITETVSEGGPETGDSGRRMASIGEIAYCGWRT